jgi:hypothetical protein
MITGFNTDVRHRGLVFHVQTEDKGAANPVVESLVYVGGRVLASKRAEYAALGIDKGDRGIQAIMERQHRLMIAAIQGGRLDHKLVAAEPVGEGGDDLRDTGVTDIRQPILSRAGVTEEVAPAEAPAHSLVQEIARAEAAKTLDQVILEYLAFEAEQEHLAIELDSGGELHLGSRPVLGIRARSTRSSAPVSGVQVLVKLISTVGQPLILGAGSTDARGRLDLPVDIPLLPGVCALIVTGASPLGNAEIKQLL